MSKKVRAKPGIVRRNIDPTVKKKGRPSNKDIEKLKVRHRMIETPVYYGLFIP